LIALMFAIVKDMSNDTIYLDKKEQERFARQLAIERRMHRDQAQLDARRAQVKGMLQTRRK
ncbi:glycine/betaine ABC transporter, partial [Mycobacterium tuberculosis]|nr:glycine/betaine ABC transporter [Mycobacterium tuberculosis]